MHPQKWHANYLCVHGYIHFLEPELWLPEFSNFMIHKFQFSASPPPSLPFFYLFSPIMWLLWVYFKQSHSLLMNCKWNAINHKQMLNAAFHSDFLSLPGFLRRSFLAPLFLVFYWFWGGGRVPTTPLHGQMLHAGFMDSKRAWWHTLKTQSDTGAWVLALRENLAHQELGSLT